VLRWAIGSTPVVQAVADDSVGMGFHVKIKRDRSEVQSALEFWAGELGRKFNVPTQVRFYDDMRTKASLPTSIPACNGSVR